ncbi:hypothetical protein IJH33_01370 [Candidatus Saccharibacteria bacterium]|nr:hypothetical protein [Candidatus Saccharibacteria bacterium]
MNKDVIYIEPEDDITDIITKIENAKQKIVALVPPKKAGVLRSIVNIKLIAKAGATAKKTVVLVTTDPSIVKLAAATKLPVTKDLQTAPVIPKAEERVDTTSSEKLSENLGEEDSADETPEEESDKEADLAEKVATDPEDFMAEEKPADDAEDEKTPTSKKADADKDAPDAEEKKSDKKKDTGEKKKLKDKLAESKNPVLRWIGKHPKIAVSGCIGAVVLILVLVWAFAIAPAATVTITLRTATGNFSENVTFTDKLTEENVSEGKFYLTEKKLESKAEVEFEATGKKNVGEKAKGSVVVYTYFPITEEGGTVAINAGSTFTNNGLSFTSDAGATLKWDGDITALSKDCENYGEASLKTSGCQVSTRIAVTATGSGEKYNIAAVKTGWTTTANVAVYSDKAMTGGTDKTVTVVQQSDIDKALSTMKDSSESVNKQKLLDTINDDEAFVIDSSFTQTTGEATSTPAVGEEVEDGKKAKLTVVTTDTIFTIDETKVKEFISEKAKLANNFKIYTMNDPFVENFLKTDTGYAGKLKTSYVSGPKMTENDVINVIRGKGLGTAQHDLNEAYGDGIKTMTTDTSFPWVMSIPDNPDKITVIIKTDES